MVYYFFGTRCTCKITLLKSYRSTPLSRLYRGLTPCRLYCIISVVIHCAAVLIGRNTDLAHPRLSARLSVGPVQAPNAKTKWRRKTKIGVNVLPSGRGNRCVK